MNTHSDLLPHDIMQWLLTVTDDPELTQFSLVQPLWSNFGKLIRCFSPRRQAPLIVKWICQPEEFNHPRGWNSQTSQQRKWQSYAVEREYYRAYAKPHQYAVPQLIAQQQIGDSQVLVLSDLDDEGFPLRPAYLTLKQCEPVLQWLAAFHAEHLNTLAHALWQRGSYWHLATRQDEWHAMESGPLKDAAAALDSALRNCPFQTLIHGDAKLANFCFSRDLTRVAAVDFQYVGGGIGVQDVTYFLGSALSDEDLLNHTPSLLNIYFEALSKRLSAHYDKQTIETLCDTWRNLYNVASADFHRFLSGWSPSHAKINESLQHHTRLALAQIN